MNKRNTPRNKMTGATMRGGLEVDDLDQHPDANYWRWYAEGTLDTLMGMCADEEIKQRLLKIMCKFWNTENTWMNICLRIEHLRDLVRALCH